MVRGDVHLVDAALHVPPQGVGDVHQVAVVVVDQGVTGVEFVLPGNKHRFFRSSPAPSGQVSFAAGRVESRANDYRGADPCPGVRELAPEYKTDDCRENQVGIAERHYQRGFGRLISPGHAPEADRTKQARQRHPRIGLNRRRLPDYHRARKGEDGHRDGQVEGDGIRWLAVGQGLGYQHAPGREDRRRHAQKSRGRHRFQARTEDDQGANKSGRRGRPPARADRLAEKQGGAGGGEQGRGKAQRRQGGDGNVGYRGERTGRGHRLNQAVKPMAQRLIGSEATGADLDDPRQQKQNPEAEPENRYLEGVDVHRCLAHHCPHGGEQGRRGDHPQSAADRRAEAGKCAPPAPGRDGGLGRGHRRATARPRPAPIIKDPATRFRNRSARRVASSSRARPAANAHRPVNK